MRMAFVKLDCGLLDSTLWTDRNPRDIFITALLMAVPFEVREPEPQIEVRTLELTGFKVRPGWYGFVAAAGSGIVRRSGMEMEAGLDALEKLGSPDPESRTPDHDGRRLVRVNDGFIVLNYIKYREKDSSTAARSRRYRENKLIRKSRAEGTPDMPKQPPASEWHVAHGVELPEAWRSKLALNVVKTWLDYKAEKKQAYGRVALGVALGAWAEEYTVEEFSRAVRFSIANGYGGVVRPKEDLKEAGEYLPNNG